MQTCIIDQPEKFDKTGRTINWIGVFLKKYAHTWHVHCEQQELARKVPKSWTTYWNDIQLRLQDIETSEEAHAELE